MECFENISSWDANWFIYQYLIHHINRLIAKWKFPEKLNLFLIKKKLINIPYAIQEVYKIYYNVWDTVFIFC